MNRHMYFRQQEKNELYHHGIKGQKWGIRRYQNEDGSLTEEGRERYGLNKMKDEPYIENDQKRYKKAYKEYGRMLYRMLNADDYIMRKNPEISEKERLALTYKAMEEIEDYITKKYDVIIK